MLAACTPEPEPTPTKTALFTSDEEAFAAAEETYRAYTDALNKVDTSDTQTFEPVFALTTGDFESGDRKNLSIMHAEDYVMSGATAIHDFKGISATDDFAQVVGSVCVDVSKTDIRDASDRSVVSPDRPDKYAAIVTFIAEDGVLLISHADSDEERRCD
jgi:hypothetical protein